MDRRFLALTATIFVAVFVFTWLWFAPTPPVGPVGAAAPADTTSAREHDTPVLASPPPSVTLPSPPAYEPPPDPEVVHRLG